MLPTYLVAFSTMLFAAISALTLIYTVRHFDPPEMPRTEERGWSLKALASRRFGPDVFGYVQVSQGFRPGGVNVVPGLPETLAVYRSDRLNSYELGLKAQNADGRVTANVALVQVPKNSE